MRKGMLFLILVILLSACQNQSANTNADVIDDGFGNGIGDVPPGDMNPGEVSSDGGMDGSSIDKTSQISDDEIAVDGVSAADFMIHNSEEDCWVVYDGVVFDITSFIQVHPGGKSALIPHCGSPDTFTTAFEGQHGTKKVGVLKDESTIIGKYIG